MTRIKFQPDNQVAYDKTPIQFQVLPGVRKKLKTVPDWQKQLREFLNFSALKGLRFLKSP